MKPEVQTMYEDSLALCNWREATAKAQRLGNSPAAVEAWREALYLKTKVPAHVLERLEYSRLTTVGL